MSDAGMTAYPPRLQPGCYVELSPGGAAVWLVDEDGDWSEYPVRKEVTEGTPVAYYRVSEGRAWTGLAS